MDTASSLMAGNENKIFDVKQRPIELIVGPDKASIFVHEDLIRRHSPFFESALSKERKEKQQGVVAIPEDEPGIVELYVKYLYEIHGEKEVGKLTWTNFTKLYTLAEKLLDKQFQNSAIDKIIKTTLGEARQALEDGVVQYGSLEVFVPRPEIVNIIYHNTPHASPARQLVVDLQHLHGQGVQSQSRSRYRTPRLLLRPFRSPVRQ